MSVIPTTIATLATGPAIGDLRILLATLALFNVNPPTVYLYCDSLVAGMAAALKYPGKLHIQNVLDQYSTYERRAMESMPGKVFKTLWVDFMTEKINLLRWALKDVSGGVLFCDADICFTGPLPAIPTSATVALSPHMIAEKDEQRFGRYNGGFAWFSAVSYLDVWWNACATARYYEQSALEDVAAHVLEKEGEDALYEFPKTQNYGWWRLWQGKQSSQELLKEWSIHRGKSKESSGLCVEGIPLGSIHTHFQTNDMATRQFNAMVLSRLKLLTQSHTPARKLLAILEGPKAR